MIRTPRVNRLFPLLVTALLPLAAPRAEEPGNPGMLERLLHPERARKNEFEGKMFNPGGTVSGREVKGGEYSGVKSFGTKSFEGREYQGARQSWMGRLFFKDQKQLPENLQGTNRDASKKFDTKELSTKRFEGGERQSRLGSTEVFPVRDIKPKGTTQGAIDNDRQLQEKIKKGLSVDDVRNLLNKGP